MKRYVVGFVPALLHNCAPGSRPGVLSITFEQTRVVETDRKEDLEIGGDVKMKRIVCLLCRREHKPTHFLIYQRIALAAVDLQKYKLGQFASALPVPEGWRFAGDCVANWVAPGMPPGIEFTTNPSVFPTSS